MKRIALCLGISALLALAADVTQILKGIESRYNGAQTLTLHFKETYTFQKRHRTESGTLTLRKPGKIRWEYSEPPGKLFISDSQFVWYYSPDDNRAEKMRLKDTGDLRAPLAFLLGKLDFAKDFREFRTSGPAIAAIPKSENLPFTEVAFEPSSDFVIQRLTVKGQDGSTIEFAFEGEKRNPPVDDSLFKFTPPKGAEIIDSTKSQ